MKGIEMSQEYQHLYHEFGPLYDENSKILILGSFPSVKSREVNFYYGHPQNRFWRIIRAIFDEKVYDEAMNGGAVALPENLEEKKRLILENHLALWDTIDQCSIIGSQDSTIKDVKVSDFPALLSKCDIVKICCNGTASYNFFMKYAYENVKKYYTSSGGKVPDIVKLPSTSPANAAWRLPRLIEAWSKEIQKK